MVMRRSVKSNIPTNLFFQDLGMDEEINLVEPCIAFHSEWMERKPDKILEYEILVRKERFPIAVVIVVHNDISLMRATLEEVAIVVEHIVSMTELQISPIHGSCLPYSPKCLERQPRLPFIVFDRSYSAYQSLDRDQLA